MPHDLDGPLNVNFIDLFAGVGGFTLGFRGPALSGQCEFIPRLLVDVDRSACQVAVRNMPDVRYLPGDLHTLAGAELRQRAGMSADQMVHVLLGGPPCQGFSFLGKRCLQDPRNMHVVDFLRLVKELTPLVAVMENVPLMITNHNGAVIQEVCAALSAFGYASSADILNANEYGVPQIRKRAFIIAYRSDLRIAPEFPRRSHERISTATELIGASERERFEADKLPYVCVEEAIGDLPRLSAGQGDEVMRYTAPPTSGYQEMSRAGSIAVFNHRSRAHTEKFLKKIAIIGEGGRNMDLPADKRFSDNYYSQAYARLHRQGLANTITTSFGNPGSGRFTHYRELRSITVREAARLQSFPDTFVFDGDMTTQMRHVGNAVPPLLAGAVRDRVAEDILAHFSSGSSAPARPRLRRKETDQERSRVMRAVPSKNTSAELLLRKALNAAGLRSYRTHCAKLPGNPDVVFTRAKLAVFVDGCFWHGCPKCYREPASNRPYWQMKVQRNRARDVRVTDECKKAGWRVIRVWEHDVLRNAARAATRILKAFNKSTAR